MLEYLFNFLTKYIFLVFIVVLVLGIVSAFSKKIKILFSVILIGAALYFALLCLDILGIGFKPLYEFSCSSILYICNNVERLEDALFSGEVIFTIIFTKFISHPLSSVTNFISFITFLLVIICVVFLFPIQKIEMNKNNNLKDDSKEVINHEKKDK